MFFAGYCLGWIIFSGFHPANGNEKWFIYLTNWGFTFLTLYFIWATVVCVLHHLGRASDHVVMQMKAVERDGNDVEGGDGQVSDQADFNMCWYHKGMWVVFNIAANSGIVITLLYWTLIFSGKTSGLDVSTHLINSVFIVADVLLSATPVRILHLLYAWIFGLSYLLLTVIFWAEKGNQTLVTNLIFIHTSITTTLQPCLAALLLRFFWWDNRLSKLSFLVCINCDVSWA